MIEIFRNDKRIIDNVKYALIMEKESHHNHKIILDKHGVIRWNKDDFIDFSFNNDLLDLNRIIIALRMEGFDKNSEIYRKLYRDLGYSLSGYWEVFYWDWNNPEFDEYKSNTK